MKRLTTALLSIVVVGLGLPAFASAALPKTDDPLIVPGKSIGGATLGRNAGIAQEAWGHGRGNCPPSSGSCTYSRDNPAFGMAYFSWLAIPSLRIRRVIDIVINAGYDIDGDPKFDTKLAKFKTKKGIHLGSTGHAVAAAYPKAKFVHGDTDRFELSTGRGSSVVSTVFQLDGQGKGRRVTSISMYPVNGTGRR